MNERRRRRRKGDAERGGKSLLDPSILFRVLIQCISLCFI